MAETFAEWVYDSLTDVLREDYRIAEVENAFEPGKPCEQMYADVYEAYKKICNKYGVEYDDDVEMIINTLLNLSREVGCKMYAYGVRFGIQGP